MANLRIVIDTDSTGAITGITRYRDALNSLGPASARQSTEVTSAFDRIEKTLGKARSAVIGFVAAWAFTHVIRGVREVLGAAIEFEDQFSNVRKTVDATNEQFLRLSKRLMDMSRELPTSLGDLTKIAEIAGQLGIQVESIDEFTEVIAKIGITSNVSAEEASTAFGTIIAVTGLTSDKFMNLASVLTRLGNEMNANEKQILDFSVRMAGTANTFKVSQDQLLALAAAFASVGLQSEGSDTALRKIFTTIATAGAQGGKELELFGRIAKHAGVSTSEFANLSKTDMAEAFRVFIEGFANMKVSGGNAVALLKALGIENERSHRLVLQTAGGYEKLNQSMRSANDEFNGTLAINEEVRKKMETTANALNMMRNTLNLLIIDISSHFMDSIKNAAVAVTDFTGALLESDSTMRRTVIASFQAFSRTVYTFAIEPLVQLYRLFETYPETSTVLLRGIQSTAVVFTALGGSINIAREGFERLFIAAGLIAKMKFGEAFEFLKSPVKAWTDVKLQMGTVAAEFEDIIDGMGKRGVASFSKTATAATGLSKALSAIAPAAAAAGDDFAVMTDKQENALKKIDKLALDGRQKMFEYEKDLYAAGQKIIDYYSDIYEKDLEKSIKTTEEKIKHLKFWAGALADIRREGMVSGADDIKAGLEATDRQAKKVIDDMKDATKEQQKFFEEMKRNAEHIFDIMLKKGKGIGDAMQGVLLTAARSAFSNFVAHFLTPFKHAIDDLIDRITESVFGRMVKRLGDRIIEAVNNAMNKISSEKAGGIAVGMAVGGAVSGNTRGAIAGGLAGAAAMDLVSGNWIKAAIEGVAAIGVAISGMFGALRKQANKFVQEIQNPMTQAVTDLFDALQAAQAMGTLTVAQVQDARRSLAEMWGNFQDSAARAGIVGQQALATMGPFVTQWLDWLDSLELAAKEMERVKAIEAVANSVLKAAEGADTLAGGLQALKDAGVSDAIIMRRLGSDIEQMYDALTDLGLPIPPLIKMFHDMAEAEKELLKNKDRQKDVERELADVRERSAGAIIRKLEYLEGQITSSRQKIEQWGDKIVKLNEEIDTTNKKLADAKYWQKEYESAIRETEQELKRATDERKSALSRIASLEEQIQRDELDASLENARASKDEMAISAAERQIEQFEAGLRSRERQNRLVELRQLQDSLPGIIQQEQAAKAAFAESQAAARADIIERQNLMHATIKTKTAERDALQANIEIEKDRIDVLWADYEATEYIAKRMGVVRKTELEEINDGIKALIDRGIELEKERTNLSRLTGVAQQTNDVFVQLGGAFTAAAASARAAINTLRNEPLAPPVRPPAAILPPTVPTPRGNPNVPNDLRGVFGLPTYDVGTDYVPYDQVAYLHRGERVMTAGENAQYSSGGDVSMSLRVDNISVTPARGQSPDDAVSAVVRALELNKNRIREKMRELITPMGTGKLVIK